MSSPPCRTVGGTAATRMQNKVSRKSISASNCVRKASSLIRTRTGASASVMAIVDSILWVFVSRRSLRAQLFSDVEFSRFVDSMSTTAERINSFPDEAEQQKFVKFHHDTFLCKLFKDPRTPKPVDAFVSRPLYSGWMRRNVARALARGDTSLLYSLQKGTKAAWPQLPEREELMALGEHAVALSSEPVPVHAVMKERITFVSRRIFSDMSRVELFSKFVPSGSACLQASRRWGGALALTVHDLNPFEGADQLGKIRALCCNIETWRSAEHRWFLDCVERGLRADPSDMAPPGYVDSHVLLWDVQATAIAEPSKFRIITVGDGYAYSAIQPFQGALLRCWKNDRSSTMRDQDLSLRVQGLLDHAPMKDWVWFSGDFSKATDGLAPWATMAAFDGVPYGCPLWGLAYQVLQLGTCYYRKCIIDGKVHRKYTIKVRNGQMMGHPLSFPFLCVINKACYDLAVESFCSTLDCTAESEEVKRTLRDQVPLINGDDILFRGPVGLREHHNRICGLVGFKPSLGKDYASPCRAMINSQVFEQRGSVVVRRGYLNQRFRTGVSVKSGESLARPTELSRDINSMVDLCPWAAGMVPECLKRFDLRKIGFSVNWFLPTHLGGLGLEATGDYRITREQRLLANHFIHDPSLSLYWTKGVELRVAEMFPNLARLKLVPWAGPVRSQQESEEILVRLAYAIRISDPRVDPPEGGLRRIVRKWRHRPLTPEGVKLWWNARLVCESTMPEIPPLLPFYGLPR